MESKLHIPKSIAYFLDLQILMKRICVACDETVVYRYSCQNLQKIIKISQSCIKYSEIHVSSA